MHEKERKYLKNIEDRINSDVCGPIKPIIKEGHKYFQVIMDEFSHYLVVKLLKNKDKAESNLMVHIQMLEVQKEVKTNTIHLHNGGEFKSNTFGNFCNKKGIDVQYTFPYTPQLNGISER